MQPVTEPIEISKAAWRRLPSVNGGERLLLVVKNERGEMQTLYVAVESVQAGDAIGEVASARGGPDGV